MDMNNYNKKILKGNLLILKKIFILIAGPFVNLIFIIIFFLRGKEELVYINMFIFLFNMMPIYPLDGGKIVENVLNIVGGKLKSLEITMAISKIAFIVFTALNIYLMVNTKNIIYLFAIFYLFFLFIKEEKNIKIKIKMYKILKNYIAIN